MENFPKALSHGALTQVADGVYSVRGSFGMGPGVTIGRTMTVLKTDEGLVILNATRLNESAQAELDALGPVKHLVKLSDSHSVDEPYYADHYKATVWSIPGAKLGDLKSDKTLGPDGPVAGGTVIDFSDTEGWREAAYHVPLGGGTLVTCDAVQNCADSEHSNFMGKLMMKMMGFKGGVVVPPMWRKFQKLQGPKVGETLAGLTPLAFENLVTGHGPAVMGGADAQVRGAIEAVSA